MKRILLSAIGCTAFATLGWSIMQQGGGGPQPTPPFVAWFSEMNRFAIPYGGVPELQATPPALRQVLEFEGSVHVQYTGAVRTDGKRQTVITTKDDIDDLDTLELFFNGVLKKTATRSNGKIVDDLNTGVATATIVFWVPEDYPFTILLRWIGADGSARVVSCTPDN